MRTTHFFMSITNILALTFILLACSKSKDSQILATENLYDIQQEPQATEEKRAKYNYLALGDSYTVGQNVDASESFPAQLEKLLEKNLNAKINTDLVATTGWRTDNLIDGIKSSSLEPVYDFVTLLIGVNNQYQGQPFSQYEEEFPLLLERALKFTGNDPSKVIVISIPDYGYTPFGENGGMQAISKDIDTYNAFAESTASLKNVAYVNITDISRQGLDQPELVADDGLHPSGKAYKMFVDRIAPFIVSALKD